MDEIISQPEETRETGEEIESTKAQKLDDATYEPQTYVEQTRDYKQSESIQADFTTVVGNSAKQSSEQNKDKVEPEDHDKSSGKEIAHKDAGPANREEMTEGPSESVPEEGEDENKPTVASIDLPNVQEQAHVEDAKIKESDKLGKDPLTGKEFGGESGGSEQENQEAMAGSEASGDYSLDAMPAEQASGDETEDRSQAQVGGNVVADGKLDDPTAAEQTLQGEEHLIPENLPQIEKGFIGEGTHGMLDGSGPGEVHSGPIKGYGPGYKEGSHSTQVPGSDFADGYKNGYMPGGSSSGGGLPVHGYGPGAVGDGDVTIVEVDNKEKAKEGQERVEVIGGKCVDADKELGDHKIICKNNGDYVAFVWNTVDGGNPTPYTGSGVGGEKPQPQVIGGADQESGHFNAVVSVGGKMVGGAGSGAGGEVGTEGDEGHWYGGIFASAVRPNNPDDPDYYTPNVLDKADKAKKVSS